MSNALFDPGREGFLDGSIEAGEAIGRPSVRPIKLKLIRSNFISAVGIESQSVIGRPAIAAVGVEAEEEEFVFVLLMAA